MLFGDTTAVYCDWSDETLCEGCRVSVFETHLHRVTAAVNGANTGILFVTYYGGTTASRSFLEE
jgi:hypothetical protein